MIKTCMFCGKVFEVSWSGAKYCSKDCYHKSTITRVTKICPVCKEQFQLSKSVENRTYCSRACYDIEHAATKVTKLCPVCGKEFEVNTSVQNRYNVCSAKCKTAHTKYAVCKRCGKVFNVKRNHPHTYCSEICRRPPIIIECVECGKEFRRRPADVARRFCCFSCYRKHTGETLLEKKFRNVIELIGLEFDQEVQIGMYSIDFILRQYRVAIEVDGDYWHKSTHARDKRKDKFLIEHGWTVIRFSEFELNNTNDVYGLVVDRLKFIPDIDKFRIQPTISDYI